MDDDAVDPKTVTIGELIDTAKDEEAASFILECKKDDGTPSWVVIILQGEGADELSNAVQAAIEGVHERWLKEEEEVVKN